MIKSSFFLLCLIGITLHAQIDTTINLSFEDKLPDWLEENKVPAIGVGLIEGGEIKYIKVFGKLKADVPAPNNSIFNIASLTKPVVGMLTLKLVEAGLWDLEEPLFHYWIDPDVINNPLHKKLNTRHVLTHQTGFVNWRSDHPTGKLTFDFEPGTGFHYSGEGFEYLRKALEHKFQQTLTEISTRHLFKPLGMNDTWYRWDENVDQSRFASWHDAKGNLHRPSRPQGGVNAAASILTTIEDFSNLCKDLIDGAGLSPDLFDALISPHVKIKEHYGKAMGWEVITDLPNGEYALEHSGSSLGVKTMAIVLPKSKRGLILFTNGDNGLFVYNNVIKEGLDIGEALLNQMKGFTSNEIIALSDDQLEKYTGMYLDSYRRTLHLSRKENYLEMSANELPTVKLFPQAENKFFIKELDVQFEFATKDSLVIFQDGKVDCTAIRIEHSTAVKLPGELLQSYEGTYLRSDENSNLYVVKEGSMLKLTGESIPEMKLQATGKNTFFAEGFVYQFEFVKDDQDHKMKINITENSAIILNAKRLK